MSVVERRLDELGWQLVRRGKLPATHCPFSRTGKLLFIGGVATQDDLQGAVGREITPDCALTAAREMAARLLDTVDAALGGLDAVAGILQVTLLIRAEADGGLMEAIADAFSEALTALLGARGRHTRTVLGALALPHNAWMDCGATVLLR